MSELNQDPKVTVATAWNFNTELLLKALGLEGNKHVISIDLHVGVKDQVTVSIERYVTVAEMEALTEAFFDATPIETVSIKREIL